MFWRPSLMRKPDWIVSMTFGAVVIGRNEGERLKRCLRALSSAEIVVYVDSGSTDGTPDWARAHGADVVELDMTRPFTAARARNAGYDRLRKRAPNLRYVQFIDGDCELLVSFPERAIGFLDQNSSVAAVCGHTREREPDRSIYNWLCEQEWDQPAGEVKAFGGIVMMRSEAFTAVEGYREDLIAGEEPELGVRLRLAGWRLWRLDVEMTFHDAAMTRFGQWWQRAMRGGYAYAQGADLHGSLPERHWVWESRRALLWGCCLPLACLALGLLLGPWGWALFLIYPLQIGRQTFRNSGSPRRRVMLALFQVLARFAEAVGQLKYRLNRLLYQQGRLIEYRRS